MSQPPAEEFELTITDEPGPKRAPGFHETSTRTYYVASDGAVYLLAAPGQRAMLQAIDALPPDATAAGEIRDSRLRTLAEVAEDLGATRRPPARRAAVLRHTAAS